MDIAGISENARTVLEKRYLAKDETGKPLEDIAGMFSRIAKAVAAADGAYAGGDSAAAEATFYDMMTSLRFLPNSPTLMNAGRPLGQLSACFVLPVPDSMEEIFEAVKDAALIHKSGGGTGFSFSRLRQQGATVQSTGGVASGPISFMRVFNTATEAVKQGGTRRGANMGILRVDHPDILAFITCKQNTGEINNFNISVGITETFMEAVEKGGDYALIDPNNGETTGMLAAREVFARIVDAAWATGEPGIVFLDRINRDNAVPAMGRIESTNPCGEQPLLPYESCNLGSINLTRMLKTGDAGLTVDYALLKQTVFDAVHFLDNVIDVNVYPLPKISEVTRSTRKIGLGVMGFADMLLRLGIPYDSDEGVAFGEELMRFINDTGHEASRELAKVRGAFPLFHESIFRDGPAVRNATVTTIAPTGTLSIIAGCSSGVEPVFAYAYIRNIMDGTEMVEKSPVLEAAMQQRGIDGETLWKAIALTGSAAHCQNLPEDMRRVFVCAHDITPEYHTRMQAAFQKHVDNAVSKTVNFPKDATRQDVEDVYRLAYRTGCKGVTIYRDGSRAGQVLNIGSVNADKTPAAAYGHIEPRPRPAVTRGVTERMRIGCGYLYVTVNYDENGICEVFTSTGKAGGCPSQSEATARLASIALRSGIAVEEVIDQLRGIRCPSTIRQSGMQCTSCPDAIARVLKKVVAYIAEDAGRTDSLIAEPVTGKPAIKQPVAEAADPAACPECGGALAHESGCAICRACGYSKCG